MLFSELIQVDNEHDVVVICGIPYARQLFEMFGGVLPVGAIFRLTERSPDGVIDIDVLESPFRFKSRSYLH